MWNDLKNNEGARRGEIMNEIMNVIWTRQKLLHVNVLIKGQENIYSNWLQQCLVKNVYNTEFTFVK